MTLAHWAAAHRRSILFMLATATLAGVFGIFNLPVALFPHIDFPRVSISLDAGDRPTQRVVNEITRPVEAAVKVVPGLREVRSTTSRGSAQIDLNFTWGDDMDRKTLQVESALARVLPSLPQGTHFEVRRMNPTALYPVTSYSLISKTIGQVDLRNIALHELVPLLSAVPGVASVSVQGGAKREYRVDVHPDLLVSYHLSFNDVVKALSFSNILQVVGRVKDQHKMLLAISDTHIKSLDAIRHTIIRSGGDGIIELGDVATVKKDVAPQTSIIDEDGQPAVILQVFQQPDGNTVQVVQNVAQALAGFRDKIPQGVKIRNWYDQSQLVIESAHSVRDAIFIGIGLAALVLYLFLRDAAITLTAIIAVPAVLSATVLLLYVLGMSFNIMTLGGMAAAIGLIVDDAIVMIEQIVRHIGNDKSKRHENVRRSIREFLPPLAGSSASTVIIFLPLAFLSGVTGAFFKALSLTMACALTVSFFVAWFAIPLLADHLAGSHDEDSSEGGRFFKHVLFVYRNLFAHFIKRPWLAAIPVVVLVGLGGFAYLHVGSGFMPAMDEGGFILDYASPPGTSLKDTNALLEQVGKILKHTPEVLTYSRRTGQQLGGGLTEPNTGDFFVRLKPMPRRNIEEIMSEVRKKVEARVPGLQIDLAQLMEDVIGDLTSVPQPVEIKLFGNDSAALQAEAPKIANAISGVRGIVDIKSGVVVAGDSLDIRIDRTKAALEELDPAAVTEQLNNYLSGIITTKVQKGENIIGVRAWIPKADRATPNDLRKLPIYAPDGHRVPLGRIAKINLLVGQPELDRDNLKPVVAVTARIEGRDMGSTVAAVKKILSRPGLLPGTMYYKLGGLYAQQQIAFRGLMSVLVAAFALVFLLLLFLYERFSIAVSIILMPLIALSAVFIGLWVTSIELNISSMMGMTMIVGIVTEVAIFYFSEYYTLLKDGMKKDEALAKAGTSRFRPIAMTTLAAILALLPLALNIGQGSAMQQPLAISIISGLIVQMPLVLLVMPALFARITQKN